MTRRRGMRDTQQPRRPLRPNDMHSRQQVASVLARLEYTRAHLQTSVATWRSNLAQAEHRLGEVDAQIVELRARLVALSAADDADRANNADAPAAPRHAAPPAGGAPTATRPASDDDNDDEGDDWHTIAIEY